MTCNVEIPSLDFDDLLGVFCLNDSLTVPSADVLKIHKETENKTKVRDASNEVSVHGSTVTKRLNLTKMNLSDLHLVQYELDMLLQQHPNFVGATGMALEENFFYIQMNRMTPFTHIAKAVQVQNAQVLPAVIEIMLMHFLKGLEYLQDKELTHGDIKPGNLFIYKNVCKLGDFGSVIPHMSVDDAIEIYGRDMHSTSTLYFRYNGDDKYTSRQLDNRYDMLALFFSLLIIMLRNKHPVFLLPAMVGIEAAEQEYEFSEALKANPDLLDALEQDNILHFPPGAVRNVLRGMGKLEWEERLLPKDALTLLPASEPDPGPLASFMQTMFPHGLGRE